MVGGLLARSLATSNDGRITERAVWHGDADQSVRVVTVAELHRLRFVQRNIDVELRQAQQRKALPFDGLRSRSRRKTSRFCNKKSTFT